MDRKHKRLLFDRRYGWVLDEWKEPSEEALSGGRGMFCILPLAKALLQKSSESSNGSPGALGYILNVNPASEFIGFGLWRAAHYNINFVASSMLKVIETPELISPKVVQSNLAHHVHNIASSVKKIESRLRGTSTCRHEEEH